MVELADGGFSLENPLTKLTTGRQRRSIAEVVYDKIPNSGVQLTGFGGIISTAEEVMAAADSATTKSVAAAAKKGEDSRFCDGNQFGIRVGLIIQTVSLAECAGQEFRRDVKPVLN